MGFTNEEMKKEATVPLTTRIDLRTLAGIAQYFESKGVVVNTMSALVNEAVELLMETVVWQGTGAKFKSLQDAESYLRTRRLMQRRMYGAGKGRRLHLAIGFEELRKDGVDPVEVAPEVYNTMHGKDEGVGEREDLISAARSALSQLQNENECFEHEKVEGDDEVLDNPVAEFNLAKEAAIQADALARQKIKKDTKNRKKAEDAAKTMTHEDYLAACERIAEKDRKRRETENE